jgi:hypothetical protein
MDGCLSVDIAFAYLGDGNLISSGHLVKPSYNQITYFVLSTKVKGEGGELVFTLIVKQQVYCIAK